MKIVDVTEGSSPLILSMPHPGIAIPDDILATLNDVGRDVAGDVLPRGLQAWADFDYVGERGPWVSAGRWRQVERFKFYTRHAWQESGRWRWPLRTAARWRCDHDYYAFPFEKTLVELVRRPQQVS